MSDEPTRTALDSRRAAAAVQSFDGFEYDRSAVPTSWVNPLGTGVLAAYAAVTEADLLTDTDARH